MEENGSTGVASGSAQQGSAGKASGLKKPLSSHTLKTMPRRGDPVDSSERPESSMAGTMASYKTAQEWDDDGPRDATITDRQRGSRTALKDVWSHSDRQEETSSQEEVRP